MIQSTKISTKIPLLFLQAYTKPHLLLSQFHVNLEQIERLPPNVFLEG